MTSKEPSKEFGHVVRRLKSAQAMRISSGGVVIDVVVHKIGDDWVRVGVLAPSTWSVLHIKKYDFVGFA